MFAYNECINHFTTSHTMNSIYEGYWSYIIIWPQHTLTADRRSAWVKGELYSIWNCTTPAGHCSTNSDKRYTDIWEPGRGRSVAVSRVTEDCDVWMFGQGQKSVAAPTSRKTIWPLGFHNHLTPYSGTAIVSELCWREFQRYARTWWQYWMP